MQSNIPSSQFKANCLRLIDQVAVDKQKIIITKRGKPLVRLVALEDIKDNDLQKEI